MKIQKRMLLQQLSSSLDFQRTRFRSTSKTENWPFLLRLRSLNIMATPDIHLTNVFMASSHVPFSYLKVYRYVVLFLNLLVYWRVSQGEQIKATMENGLLTVTFPKALPEHAPKKIVIQNSDKEGYETDFNLWILFHYSYNRNFNNLYIYWILSSFIVTHVRSGFWYNFRHACIIEYLYLI